MVQSSAPQLPERLTAFAVSQGGPPLRSRMSARSFCDRIVLPVSLTACTVPRLCPLTIAPIDAFRNEGMPAPIRIKRSG